jgi:hypothetical protein
MTSLTSPAVCRSHLHGLAVGVAGVTVFSGIIYATLLFDKKFWKRIKYNFFAIVSVLTNA